MSDADLRELERRFRETGAVEDEAAWLGARVQAGELGQSRLELAAALGNSAAQFVLGEPAVNLEDWVDGFAWSPSPLKSLFAPRAAIAAAAVAAREQPMGNAWLTSLWAAEQATVTRSVCEVRKAEAAGELAFDLCQQLNSEPDPVRAAGVSLACAGLSVTGNFRAAERSVLSAAHVFEASTSQREAWNCVRAAVASELVPWALGYGDPVRERVEARQREGLE